MQCCADLQWLPFLFASSSILQAMSDQTLSERFARLPSSGSSSMSSRSGSSESSRSGSEQDLSSRSRKASSKDSRLTGEAAAIQLHAGKSVVRLAAKSSACKLELRPSWSRSRQWRLRQSRRRLSPRNGDGGARMLRRCGNARQKQWHRVRHSRHLQRRLDHYHLTRSMI